MRDKLAKCSNFIYFYLYSFQTQRLFKVFLNFHKELLPQIVYFLANDTREAFFS